MCSKLWQPQNADRDQVEIRWFTRVQQEPCNTSSWLHAKEFKENSVEDRNKNIIKD